MATLQELQPAIDTGTIVERTGHHSSQDFWIKELVFKEGETYIWAQFDTREPKPGCAGFDTFQKVIDNDRAYYEDGMGHWFPIKKEVPHQPGSRMGKFFYLWLTNWCEEWRKEKREKAQAE